MKTFIILLFLIPLKSRAQDAHYTLAGQNIFVPALGSTESLTSHPRFEGLIQKMFNRPSSFGGPNCYNTALIASGYMSDKDFRYVSPNEFEVVLKENFIQVTDPMPGDVVVFDANSSRGHAAYYLGDNLIFHKKSHSSKYFYRITTMENVGIVEENEWTPGPFDGPSSQVKWPELGKLPTAFYRLVSKLRPELDETFGPILLLIEKELTKDLKNWDIGSNWGMTGEYLLQDFSSYLREVKANNYTQSLAISFSDQLFNIIEETYFHRIRRSPEGILKQICVPENKQQMYELFKLFTKSFHKDSSNLDEVWTKVENQDHGKCRYRAFSDLTN